MAKVRRKVTRRDYSLARDVLKRLIKTDLDKGAAQERFASFERHELPKSEILRFAEMAS